MFEDFSQQCLVLNAKPYGERHDTANIARVLLTMINEYEIPSHKIHCIVADNAPVMKAAVETTRYSYLGCFAHQVQLLINKTVFIQAGVKTLNSKMHKLSGHFHSSSFATAKLKEIQKEFKVPRHRLLQDVITRWNSTLYMFKSVLTNRIAVEEYCTRYWGETVGMALTHADWALCTKLVAILGYFEQLTKR